MRLTKRNVLEIMLSSMLSKKRANNHHSAEPAGRDVHEESQQPPSMQSHTKIAGRCYPRRKPTTTTTQSLLGEMYSLSQQSWLP